MTNQSYLLSIVLILMIGCSKKDKPSIVDLENTGTEIKQDDLSILTLNDSSSSAVDKEKVTYKCSLPADHPAHYDPFYNGHLHENFNPNQVDFSNEFYELRNEFFLNRSLEFKEISQYDFSKLWMRSYSQDGVIGKNYRRIEIKITESQKSSENPLIYLIKGVSKVGTNKCDFRGEINLINGYYFETPDIENTTQGVVYSVYSFKEDSTQNHVGEFKGTVESMYIINLQDNNVCLDTLSDVADGYNNNNFVGIWTAYNSEQPKKCIWGEYRLPFTFDFDVGDGEMAVNEKYRQFGWE